jgi:hypothetical protein
VSNWCKKTTDVHGPQQQSLRSSSCSAHTPPSLPNIQPQSTHTMQTLATVEAHLNCSQCVGCEQLAPESQQPTTCTAHNNSHSAARALHTPLHRHSLTFNYDQHTQCQLSQSLKLASTARSVLDDVSNWCALHTAPSLPTNIQLRSTHTLRTIAIVEAHLNCWECVGCEQQALVTAHSHSAAPTSALHTPLHRHCQTFNHNQHTQCKLYLAIIEVHLTCLECVGCEQLAPETQPTTDQTFNYEQHTNANSGNHVLDVSKKHNNRRA